MTQIDFILALAAMRRLQERRYGSLEGAGYTMRAVERRRRAKHGRRHDAPTW